MKKILLAMLVSGTFLFSCSNEKKNDGTTSTDSTETTPAPPMKAGDRTSDGGH